MVTEAHGWPIGVELYAAHHHEAILLEPTLDHVHTPAHRLPENLVGDKAFTGPELQKRILESYGVYLISPEKENVTHHWLDHRKLRRYKRRFQVERLNAWLKNFRRLQTRYEFYSQNFLGFLILACCLILWRHF